MNAPETTEIEKKYLVSRVPPESERPGGVFIEQGYMAVSADGTEIRLRRKGDRFFQFCRESLDKFPDFIEELTNVSGVGVYLSMSGSLMPASSVGEQWEERLRFFREENIPHEVWPVSRTLG